jgi:ATP-binding cassette subfamily C (CFTR/MRP) protein 1
LILINFSIFDWYFIDFNYSFQATAAIDVETDAIIQRAIRSELADCTILTIAHRLNTVMDCDRILVMDKGSVAQYGSPKTLLTEQDGIFFSLAKEAGLA